MDIYIDGACSGNPGKGGWACIFVKNDEVVNELSGNDNDTTNNRMELTAFINAIDNCNDNDIIYTDSMYVVNCFNNFEKWLLKKDLPNRDLVDVAVEKLRNGRKVKLVKVEGHSGNKYNEMADKLAVSEIKGNDKKKLAEKKVNVSQVVKSLIEKNITIVTAESITGGLISKLITDIPGSSKILKESFIVYSDEAKVNILGVDKNIIDKYGVVSSEVAFEMAKCLYAKTKRDICIATTGNAGPDVCDNKPVGRVYIGILYKGNINTYECDFTGDRNDVRVKTAERVIMEVDRISVNIF